MQKELEAVEEGQFSDRVWVLHNRQLYKYRKAEDEGKDVRAEG